MVVDRGRVERGAESILAAALCRGPLGSWPGAVDAVSERASSIAVVESAADAVAPREGDTRAIRRPSSKPATNASPTEM